MKAELGPYVDNHPRKVEVVIDNYDTWNCDETLAHIIAPLLQQLLVTKNGSFYVDDEDVPDNIKSTASRPKKNDFDVDEWWFLRADYVLTEIIWAMNEIAGGREEEDKFWNHDNEDKPVVDKEGLDAYHKRLQKACLLFGKYFQSFWD